jgi:hypothetical protein
MQKRAHNLWCIGACVHSDLEIEGQKKRREAPADPAPVPADPKKD